MVEKSQTDVYHILIIRYSLWQFQDFETYLRILTGVNEDDIQLKSKQYSSKFITYEIPLGNYTFEDLSEVISRGFINEFEIRGRIRPNHKYDRSDLIIIESDSVSLITTLSANPQIHGLRFDKKSVNNTILCFSPYWDYKNCDIEYFNEKNRK